MSVHRAAYIVAFPLMAVHNYLFSCAYILYLATVLWPQRKCIPTSPAKSPLKYIHCALYPMGVLEGLSV